MNERIFELQKQAFDFVAEQSMTKKEYFWENIRHNRYLQDRVDAKFAELIIHECARVAMNYTHLVSDAIKQHFGVEE